MTSRQRYILNVNLNISRAATGVVCGPVRGVFSVQSSVYRLYCISIHAISEIGVRTVHICARMACVAPGLHARYFESRYGYFESVFESSSLERNNGFIWELRIELPHVRHCAFWLEVFFSFRAFGCGESAQFEASHIIGIICFLEFVTSEDTLPCTHSARVRNGGRRETRAQ